jgi:hypothetical protein
MKKFVLLYLLFFSLAACEDRWMENISNPSSRDVFRHMWSTLDQKYSFFIDKNINWDSVYTVYDRRAFNIQSNLQLFDILAEVLSVLQDGHVNLSAGFDQSRYWEWYLDFPENFNFSLIERNYLNNANRASDYQISGPIHNAIIDNVGYMHYSSFSRNVSTSLMNYLVLKIENRNVNTKRTIAEGLIIDVRGNGGGSVRNAFTIANRFARERQHIADWYYKSGPGHDEFYDPVPKFIEFEGDEDYPYIKPIVILTNRSCYSATNMFVSMMKQLPNVTVIGDRTGGGGGLPINDELPNGWIYRFSSTRTLEPDGTNIEFGVEPHFYVDMNPADEAAGIDTILEYAINFIKNRP